MSTVTNDRVERHLKNAVNDMVPNRAEALWHQPVERADETAWYLDGTASRRRTAIKVLRPALAAAAVFVLVFLAYFLVNLRIQATVYLDVNPSVTLSVNSRERVIRAEANNPDGRIVLEDMNLKNTDLDVAVNALLGSMVKHGYLTETQNVVLLSVDCDSEKKSQTLRIELSRQIDQSVDAMVGSARVLDQSVDADEALVTLADRYGISPGKAALILRMQRENPALDLDKLAAMPLYELASRFSGTGVDPEDYADLPDAFPEDPYLDELEDLVDDLEDAQEPHDEEDDPDDDLDDSGDDEDGDGPEDWDPDDDEPEDDD